MPYDRECHLGYPNAKLAFDFAKRVGFPIVDTDNNNEIVDLDKFLKSAPTVHRPEFSYPEEFKQRLHIAWRKSIDDMGWALGTIIDKDGKPAKSRYNGVISPWGNREAAYWVMHADYDPHEMGHTPEDWAIGVNLSSRYFPTFMDMKDAHGTLSYTILLNDEFFNYIKVAKENLVAVIPEMHDAQPYLRDKWY